MKEKLKPIKKCENCMELYHCRKDRINTSRFCSTKCLTSFISKARPRNKSQNKILKNCEECMAQYSVWPTNKESRFCSRVCFNQFKENKSSASRVKKECDNCGRSYLCRSDKIKSSRFCNISCKGSAISRANQKIIHDKWQNESRQETLDIMSKSFEKFFKSGDDNQCWEWMGHKKSKLPYGGFVFRGKSLIASRVSYMLYIGKIPEGKIVLHNCDNPSCVNPSHLRVGTYLDNQIDKLTRGRGKVEKLNIEQVTEIKKLLKTKIPDRRIAMQYNVSPTTIGRIKKEKLWSWVKV